MKQFLLIQEDSSDQQLFEIETPLSFSDFTDHFTEITRQIQPESVMQTFSIMINMDLMESYTERNFWSYNNALDF